MEQQSNQSQRIKSLITVFGEPEEKPDWEDLDARNFGPPFWEDKHLTARIVLFLMGSSAVPALIKAVQSNNVQIIKHAVLVLCDLEDPRAAEALLELFKNEASGEGYWGEGFLRLIAGGLATTKVKSVIPELCKFLVEAPELQRACIAEILGDFHEPSVFEPLVLALKDPSGKVRNNAAHSLGVLGDPRGYEPVLELVKRDFTYSAITALGNLGNLQAYDLLVDILRTSKDHFSASGAAYALGMLGDNRAFEPLVTAFQSRDSTLSSSAITGLGLLGTQQAIDFLLQLLNNKASYNAEAAQALGLTKSEQAFEPLIEAMKSDEFWLAYNAINGLGELGDVRAIEPIMEAIKDDEASIRLSAASALGKLGDNQVLPILENLALTDIEPTDTQGYCDRVCEEAVKAIKLIRRKLLDSPDNFNLT